MTKVYTNLPVFLILPGIRIIPCSAFFRAIVFCPFCYLLSFKNIFIKQAFRNIRNYRLGKDVFYINASQLEGFLITNASLNHVKFNVTTEIRASFSHSCIFHILRVISVTNN